MKFSGKNNDCSDLRKRGLCLVPLSKLVNYFGWLIIILVPPSLSLSCKITSRKVQRNFLHVNLFLIIMGTTDHLSLSLSLSLYHLWIKLNLVRSSMLYIYPWAKRKLIRQCISKQVDIIFISSSWGHFEGI